MLYQSTYKDIRINYTYNLININLLLRFIPDIWGVLTNTNTLILVFVIII